MYEAAYIGADDRYFADIELADGTRGVLCTPGDSIVLAAPTAPAAYFAGAGVAPEPVEEKPRPASRRKPTPPDEAAGDTAAANHQES